MPPARAGVDFPIFRKTEEIPPPQAVHEKSSAKCVIQVADFQAFHQPCWSLDFLVGTVHWEKPLSLLLYTAGGFCLRPVFSLYSGYLAQFLHSSSLAELMSGVSKKIRWLVRTTIVFMHVQYLHH
jgi:hypothetical protein